MTKSEKDNILFHTNEKANEATKLRYKHIEGSNAAEFYRGQYMAFVEMYSLISNIHAEDE